MIFYVHYYIRSSHIIMCMEVLARPTLTRSMDAKWEATQVTCGRWIVFWPYEALLHRRPWLWGLGSQGDEAFSCGKTGTLYTRCS